jgi:hypothetical protein
MGRVYGLFAYLAWLKDCSDPQGDPNVLVHAVLQIDDPTASDHQREATHDALVAANKTRFAWFSCTAKGEVDAAWDGPRDVIAWVTPDAIYKLEAPKGDMATQLVRDLVATTA